MKHKLYYDRPAKSWQEALPLGNGFVGMMVWGGESTERLSFNDGTLWSGYPKDQTNSESLKYIDKVREFVFAGKNVEADKLCMEKMSGGYSEGYLPLGELILTFSPYSSSQYYRELDISSAVHTVGSDGIKREAFCSYPDKICAYHMESKACFSLSVSAQSKLQSEIMTDNGLNLMGNAPDHVVPNYLQKEEDPVRYNEGRGMGFCLRCEAKSDGEITIQNGTMQIENAHSITLYISTGTGFVAYDQMPQTNRRYALEKCKDILASAKRDYAILKKSHIADYQSIFNQQILSLDGNYECTANELVQEAKEGNVSQAFCELLYNYGKYLMISGSRKGAQAMNLQGIWNESVRPPWSCNYTTNINTQMNYWAASRSGLSDCLEPYFNFIYNIAQNGKKTARINYGCEGFCCNQNVDIWCKTTPVKGNPAYMFSPLCGAWLANEAYSHYKNGELTEYRDHIFEIITDSTKFINDYLVLHHGLYVTAPSSSPEIDLLTDEGAAGLDYASTFEMSIVRKTFLNYLEFADDFLAEEIKGKIPKLYPFMERSIGINEWHKDYQVKDKGHRHFSPMYGFYPADIIKYHENITETNWIRKLFEYRLANSNQYIGWSGAWAVCLCGRLHDGVTAKMVLKKMLGHSIHSNLFCVHPPLLFQIDGNFGFVAGVNELLVYEENGVIDLLPAIPDDWNCGEVKNMVVNGTKVSFKWKDGVVTNIDSVRAINVSKSNLSPDLIMNENVHIVIRA